jgi:hypothetical protein
MQQTPRDPSNGNGGSVAKTTSAWESATTGDEWSSSQSTPGRARPATREHTVKAFKNPGIAALVVTIIIVLVYAWTYGIIG